MHAVAELLMAALVLLGGNITLTMRQLPSGELPQAGQAFQHVWMVWPDGDSVDGLFYFIVDYPDDIDVSMVDDSGDVVCTLDDDGNTLVCATDTVSTVSRAMVSIAAKHSFDADVTVVNRVESQTVSFNTEVSGGSAVIPRDATKRLRTYFPFVEGGTK